MFSGKYTPLHNQHYSILNTFKGTECAISSDPPCKRWQCQIYNITLETLI